MDESRGVAQQQVPFANGASDEPESIGPEIAKASVDEARRLAACPGREIAPVDQRGGEAAARRVPRDPGPNDPGSDDEDLERFVPHPLEVRRPGPSRELGHADPITRVPGFMMPSGSSSRFRARNTTSPSSPMTRDR